MDSLKDDERPLVARRLTNGGICRNLDSQAAVRFCMSVANTMKEHYRDNE